MHVQAKQIWKQLGVLWLILIVSWLIVGCQDAASTIAEIENEPRKATATQSAVETRTSAGQTATVIASTPTATPSPTIERLGTVTPTPSSTPTALPAPVVTRISPTATVVGGGGGGGTAAKTPTPSPTATRIPPAPAPPTATNTPGPTPIAVAPVGVAAICGDTLQIQMRGTPVYVDSVGYSIREKSAVGKYLISEVDITNISDNTFGQAQPRSFSIYGYANDVAYYFDADWRASWLTTLDTGSDWLGSDLLPGVVNHSVVVFDVNEALTNWVVIFQSSAFTGADCEVRLALAAPVHR